MHKNKKNEALLKQTIVQYSKNIILSGGGINKTRTF